VSIRIGGIVKSSIKYTLCSVLLNSHALYIAIIPALGILLRDIGTAQFAIHC
jgi:hypothetical protein